MTLPCPRSIGIVAAAVLLSAAASAQVPSTFVEAAKRTAGALRSRGLELGFNLDHAEALAAFRAAIAADPEDPAAYLLTAAALWTHALTSTTRFASCCGAWTPWLTRERATPRRRMCRLRRQSGGDKPAGGDRPAGGDKPLGLSFPHASVSTSNVHARGSVISRSTRPSFPSHAASVARDSNSIFSGDR